MTHDVVAAWWSVLIAALCFMQNNASGALLASLYGLLRIFHATYLHKRILHNSFSRLVIYLVIAYYLTTLIEISLKG
jgi:hypothetical protein